MVHKKDADKENVHFSLAGCFLFLRFFVSPHQKIKAASESSIPPSRECRFPVSCHLAAVGGLREKTGDNIKLVP